MISRRRAHRALSPSRRGIDVPRAIDRCTCVLPARQARAFPTVRGGGDKLLLARARLVNEKRRGIALARSLYIPLRYLYRRCTAVRSRKSLGSTCLPRSNSVYYIYKSVPPSLGVRVSDQPACTGLYIPRSRHMWNTVSEMSERDITAMRNKVISEINRWNNFVATRSCQGLKTSERICARNRSGN